MFFSLIHCRPTITLKQQCQQGLAEKWTYDTVIFQPIQYKTTLIKISDKKRQYVFSVNSYWTYKNINM